MCTPHNLINTYSESFGKKRLLEMDDFEIKNTPKNVFLTRFRTDLEFIMNLTFTTRQRTELFDSVRTDGRESGYTMCCDHYRVFKVPTTLLFKEKVCS